MDTFLSLVGIWFGTVAIVAVVIAGIFAIGAALRWLLWWPMANPYTDFPKEYDPVMEQAPMHSAAAASESSRQPAAQGTRRS
jgi:hypothetical protein